jgi:hypothetical protein
MPTHAMIRDEVAEINGHAVGAWRPTRGDGVRDRDEGRGPSLTIDVKRSTSSHQQYAEASLAVQIDGKSVEFVCSDPQDVLPLATAFCRKHGVDAPSCPALIAARALCVAGYYALCEAFLGGGEASSLSGDEGWQSGDEGWQVRFEVANLPGRRWGMTVPELVRLRASMPGGLRTTRRGWDMDMLFLRSVPVLEGPAAVGTLQEVVRHPGAGEVWPFQLWSRVLTAPGSASGGTLRAIVDRAIVDRAVRASGAGTSSIQS